jgi:acetyltransferase-like isoleucine patch superfamily enzyme
MRGRVSIDKSAKVSIGSGSWVLRDYHFFAEAGSSILIGKGVHVGEGVRIHAMKGAQIKLEDDCWLNHHVEIVAMGSVRVGSFSRVGPHVYLIDHDHQTKKGEMIRSQDYRIAEVAVGRDCWIGARAMLLRGVAVEDGAVIAAGAVVTRSVPKDEIWGGVPAKKIGARQ